MGLGLELIQAIHAKNGKKIHELLEMIDAQTVNETDSSNGTPLHAAARKNDVNTVVKLLSICSINVNSKTTADWTPIMSAAGKFSIESLKVLLDHPAVDLDVESFDGKRLEDVIGFSCRTDSTKKSKCLEIIKEAERKRKNISPKEVEVGHANGNMETENSLEEMKNNIRKQYIEKIDKANLQVQESEQKLKTNMELKMTEIKKLEEKQNLEKKNFESESNQGKMKLEQKKTKLEEQLTILTQSLAKIQDENKKYDEEMKRKHEQEKTLLKDKFEKVDEEVCHQLASLKKMIDQLSKELRKQDMDPDDDASANLEAARDTLECPVCMEIMRPPTKIWMCTLNHLVCEPCKDQLEGRLCPTCRTEGITWRALMAEKFASTLFNN